MSSYQVKVHYDVSGFVRDASCTCKASSMGRCNHVCGLLFALLDYTQKYGYTPSTSLPCEWNKGRASKKNPEVNQRRPPVATLVQ